MSNGHFGTSAKMSWVRSVLGPTCLYTYSSNLIGVLVNLSLVVYCGIRISSRVKVKASERLKIYVIGGYENVCITLVIMSLF